MFVANEVIITIKIDVIEGDDESIEKFMELNTKKLSQSRKLLKDQKLSKSKKLLNG